MCKKENPSARKAICFTRALNEFRAVDVACIVIERRDTAVNAIEKQILGSSVAIESLQTSIEIFEEQLGHTQLNCEFDRRRMEEHHVSLLVQKSTMLSHHASLQRAYLELAVSDKARESLLHQRAQLAKELMQFSVQGCHIEHRRQAACSQLGRETIAQSLWRSATDHLSLAVSEIDLSIFCDRIMGDDRSRSPKTEETCEEHMERAMLLISSAGEMLHLDTTTVLLLYATTTPLDTSRKRALFVSVRACLDDLQAIAARRDQQVRDLEEHLEQLNFEGLEHCRQLVTEHLY